MHHTEHPYLIRYNNGTVETAPVGTNEGLLRIAGLINGGIDSVNRFSGMDLQPGGLSFDYHQSDN